MVNVPNLTIMILCSPVLSVHTWTTSTRHVGRYTSTFLVVVTPPVTIVYYVLISRDIGRSRDEVLRSFEFTYEKK